MISHVMAGQIENLPTTQDKDFDTSEFHLCSGGLPQVDTSLWDVPPPSGDRAATLGRMSQSGDRRWKVGISGKMNSNHQFQKRWLAGRRDANTPNVMHEVLLLNMLISHKFPVMRRASSKPHGWRLDLHMCFDLQYMLY